MPPVLLIPEVILCNKTTNWAYFVNHNFLVVTFGNKIFYTTNSNAILVLGTNKSMNSYKCRLHIDSCR